MAVVKPLAGSSWEGDKAKLVSYAIKDARDGWGNVICARGI